MTAWGAKIDQLSHQYDVLFIQSVGNISMGIGNQANPGLRAHLNNGLNYPDHLFCESSRLANPAQSLHALTVGSIAHETFSDEHICSFAETPLGVSPFSRTGYAPPWSVVKPDVVEFGGDLVHTRNAPFMIHSRNEQSVELLRSTLNGGPAYTKDGCGTSFATPKVAHIAACLQELFPLASPQLYRALIAQSARWPEWCDGHSADNVLRMIGYGIPSLDRATRNSDHRVTLITADAQEIKGKQLHLYTVQIPDEIRALAVDHRIRLDVTLAYTAEPRRTRVKRSGYLETWLDWEASGEGEPLDNFEKRMKKETGRLTYRGFRWTLHTSTLHGEAEDTRRTNGSLQKDWAVFNAHELPEEFAVAVRAHNGWNHRDEAGSARYCLVVGFEAINHDLEVYTHVRRANVKIENRSQAETSVSH